MKKVITIIFALLLFVAGCAENNVVVPEGCENSLIYAEAAKLGVTPQAVGTIFQLANLELLKNNVIAKADVEQFFDDVECLLDRDETTYLDVVAMVVTRVDELRNEYGPEVMVLITAFSEQLSKPIPIDECDRMLMLKHVADQRKILDMIN